MHVLINGLTCVNGVRAIYTHPNLKGGWKKFGHDCHMCIYMVNTQGTRLIRYQGPMAPRYMLRAPRQLLLTSYLLLLTTYYLPLTTYYLGTCCGGPGGKGTCTRDSTHAARPHEHEGRSLVLRPLIEQIANIRLASQARP